MLSLHAARSAIAAGRLSPEASLAEAAARIDERDGTIRAFVHRTERPQAGAGPLAGIAVGVKDIVDTADMPTEYGSPVYAGWRPKADAALVQALRRAGATLMGKTATSPFAYVDPPETRNPANPAHTPGGSSSGSAAAVAAGMVHLAIGTQTGGSIIRPASFCGCAAIKPSFRLLPTVGIKTFAWTLDTAGLFAAGIADLVDALEILSERPMEARLPDRPRIGLLRQAFAGERSEESEAALDRAAAALERAGATIVPLVELDVFAEAYAAQSVIQDYESRHALAWEYAARRDALPPFLRTALEAAQAVDAPTYDSARRVANRARREAKGLFAEIDALVTHAAPGPAPRGLDSTGQARFNRLWTLLGTPCVNVPGLSSHNGLPIGIQVVAPFARDAEALAVAGLLERALAA